MADMTADVSAASRSRLRPRGVWLIAILALLVAGAALIVSLVNTSTSASAPRAARPNAAAVPDRAPAAWASFGEQLRTRDHAKFALSSQPVDIRRPGVYLLNYGPLPASFVWPMGVGHGFGWAGPPNQHFQSVPAPHGPGKVVVFNGSRYVQFPMTVADVTRAYVGFYGWLYGS